MTVRRIESIDDLRALLAIGRENVKDAALDMFVGEPHAYTEKHYVTSDTKTIMDYCVNDGKITAYDDFDEYANAPYVVSGIDRRSLYYQILEV